MKIAMIGTGYVGLVSGVCFSDFGHEVICVDKDPRKVEMLERGDVPIFEPGLQQLMSNNVEAGRLTFTQDLARAIEGADAVFIGVGTPTRRGGPGPAAGKRGRPSPPRIFSTICRRGPETAVFGV